MDALPLRNAIDRELHGNLLPFWRERSVDSSGSGFITEMSRQGQVVPGAARGLILASRLLWTFSALYRRFRDHRDHELAQRAYLELETRFRDRTHGGYRWRVGEATAAVDATKKAYGQAFVIYSLAEYSLATGDETALTAARTGFEMMEKHLHDPKRGGYLEARTGDWQPTSALQLGDDDMIAARSMNTHLHVLEALTTLYRAWPDDTVAARLRELLELFAEHILDRGHGTAHNHLHHFFDEDWVRLPSPYTYGHDIEASWLLSEAAEVLGDRGWTERCHEWAAAIAGTTLAEGIDGSGALAYAGRDGAIVDGNRDWWCQAEAVTGFWHAYQLTGDPRFAAAAVGVWRFITDHMVDRVNGEWFWRISADGTVDERFPKVSEWKGPYHNVRMCLEMTRRIGTGNTGEAPCSTTTSTID